MVLLDATVWIDYLAGKKDKRTLWVDQAFDEELIGLLDLTLCEVLQGIRDDSVFLQTRRFLRDFEILSSGGERLALASADNYRYLRSRGITIRNTVDCLIATYCIEHGLPLLHNDRDFDPFETYLGLQVIKP